jgi:hypothetical protein
MVGTGVFTSVAVLLTVAVDVGKATKGCAVVVLAIFGESEQEHNNTSVNTITKILFFIFPPLGK